MIAVFPILAALLSSDDSDPLIYAIIGAGLGVLLFVKGFRTLQRKRLILDTPTAKVRSAAIGLVELEGQAVGPYTITAPLTRLPCFYHQTLLWKWVQRGKSSTWEKIADERLHVPFYLRDSTGMVLVDPNGAEMELHCDYKQEFHHSLFGSSAIPGPATEFMNRYGVGTDRTVKLEEYCIKPANALYVLGTLATNPGLRPFALPTPTLGGSFKLGHWTMSLKGTAGSEMAAQLLGSGLAGLSFSSTPGTQTRVSTSSFGPIKTTTTVTTTTGKTATLQPGDPRAGAVVAAIAAKDPELAAKVAAQFHVPYPPPAGAVPAASTVSVTQEPGGATKVTSVQVLGGPAALANASLMPAEAHQMAVAAIAAKNPELAAMVATALGRPQSAAAIQKAAGGDAAAPAAPGPNGESWPENNPTVVMKGTNNPAYFISWKSQKEVITELSRRAVLYIWGGPALTVVCMLYILNRFGML